jgi:REP element-mobilizing transposase RayT
MFPYCFIIWYARQYTEELFLPKMLTHTLKIFALRWPRGTRFSLLRLVHDHVHFLIKSLLNYSPTQTARIVKNITAREIFQRVPSVKKLLWGGEFWSKGFFINTVGQKGNEESIATYVRNQGRENEYQTLHREQLKLF